jgi:hypothetical protein
MKVDFRGESRWGLILAVFGVSGCAMFLGLLAHWPLAFFPGGYLPKSPFHDGHLWAFDHIARMALVDPGQLMDSPRLGFPQTMRLRFLSWPLALMGVPLNFAFGPLVAYNVLISLIPVLSGLGALVLLRRLGARAAAVPLSVLWAWGPYAAMSLANGQIEKAQVWGYPLWLYWFDRALCEGGWRAVAACSLVAAAVAFTEPSYAVLLPLLGPLWAVLRLGHLRWVRALFGGIGVMVGNAVGLAAARAYYSFVPGPTEAFMPARAVTSDPLRVPSPVATLGELFGGEWQADLNPLSVNHSAMLPTGLVMLAVLGLAFKGPYRWAGLGVVCLGVMISLGEVLVAGGDYVMWGGERVTLPSAWLAAFGYPLASSGMYYRVGVVAMLGLLVLAARLGKLGGMGVLLAWLALLGGVRETLQLQRGVWPRPLAPIAGLPLLAEIAEDERAGAVLDLPLEHDTQSGGQHLSAAAFHGRTTTALPRRMRAGEVMHLRPLLNLLDKVVADNDPRASRRLLRSQGFAFVVYRESVAPSGPAPAALTEALGTPRRAPGIWVWSTAEDE